MFGIHGKPISSTFLATDFKNIEKLIYFMQNLKENNKNCLFCIKKIIFHVIISKYLHGISIKLVAMETANDKD